LLITSSLSLFLDLEFPNQLPYPILQKVIPPEICIEYPCAVDLLENSFNYLKPKLAFLTGKMMFAAAPRALTL